MPTPAGTSTSRPVPFAEMRAVWVVRTTMSDPDAIRIMVDRVRLAGFNTIFVQIRGRGDAYYAERLDPRSEALAGQPPDFDPLDFVVQEAHARDLAVHAWINTYLVASATRLPTAAEHVVNAHPDFLAVPRELAHDLHDVDAHDPRFVRALANHARRNARTVEGLYTSPAHPEVQEQVYRIWMDLAERYELDGLHFDYLRFASPEFDYSRAALDGFRDWLTPRLDPASRRRLALSERDDPLAYVDAHPEAWSDFRRDQITRLVDRIYRGVKERRPAAWVSAAVVPSAPDAYATRFQDWEEWLRRGIIDAVAPMAYTDQDDVFRGQIREAVRLAGGGDRVWAGIGAYRNSVDGTISKIGISREETASGVVLFSYDWAAVQGGAGASYLERVGERAFLRRARR